ncbi:hypothetical protein ACVWW4_006219 [Bradyrhizobium sp. LB7.1]
MLRAINSFWISVMRWTVSGSFSWISPTERSSRVRCETLSISLPSSTAETS